MCQGQSTSVNLSANLSEIICSFCSSYILHSRKFILKPFGTIGFIPVNPKSEMRMLTKELKFYILILLIIVVHQLAL